MTRAIRSAHAVFSVPSEVNAEDAFVWLSPNRLGLGPPPWKLIVTARSPMAAYVGTAATNSPTFLSASNRPMSGYSQL